jgi:hypothetical protein
MSDAAGPEMDIGKVVEGVGLAAWGVAFYGLMRWQVRDDHRMRRLAESRWWWDRRLKGRLRRGEISKDEHFDSFIKGQRFIVNWVFTPFIAIFVALGLALAILGVTRP